MPSDAATQTIEIDAPYARVPAVLRDVQTQPQWVPEIVAADVLRRNEDGTPAVARFRASTPVGTDEYTVTYQHRRDGMSWSLLKGRLQTGQEARYDLRRLARARTSVTFALRINHNLPLVSSTLTGLKDFVEASGRGGDGVSWAR